MLDLKNSKTYKLVEPEELEKIRSEFRLLIPDIDIIEVGISNNRKSQIMKLCCPYCKEPFMRRPGTLRKQLPVAHDGCQGFTEEQFKYVADKYFKKTRHDAKGVAKRNNKPLNWTLNQNDFNFRVFNPCTHCGSCVKIITAYSEIFRVNNVGLDKDPEFGIYAPNHTVGSCWFCNTVYGDLPFFARDSWTMFIIQESSVAMRQGYALFKRNLTSLNNQNQEGHNFTEEEKRAGFERWLNFQRRRLFPHIFCY